jgi:4-amino-4-deoxy-L-arabinose transferase-like glycosyltransferase
VVRSEWRKPAHLFLWAALLAPLIIEIVCFGTVHLPWRNTWHPNGLQHFERYTAWFAAIAVVLGIFLRRYFLPVCLAVILICSVWAVGPVAVGSVLLFVFSVTVLGRLVFGATLEARVAFLAGLAFWMLAIAFTARLPIHYPATYLTALALPVALGYRGSWRLAREWMDRLRPTRRWTAPEYAALAMIVFLAGGLWLIVLKPEVSTDGLAMHMAIAADMAMHHAFTFDFRKFVWALMPMGADWCYAAVWMLGGEYASRLLNFAMLISVAVLLFHAARQFVSLAVAIFLTALFLSTPMVLLVTGSMFVENFVAAMLLAGMTALWRLHETAGVRYLLLTALLLGASVGMKLGALAAVLFALPFLGAAVAGSWRRLGARVPVVVPLAVVLFVGVAALPYVNAWMRTGNPIYPFANQHFHSPYIGSNPRDSLFIHEGRYVEPIGWSTPVRLTFDTNRYYEGQNGSFGFQYLLLLPITLAALIAIRSFEARSAAVIGIGGAILIAVATPNARYFYPLLPILATAAAAALGWLRESHRSIFAAAIAIAVAAGFANIYFLPCADWYHRDFYAAPLFSSAGRMAYLTREGGVREIVAYLNRTDKTEPVAFLDGSEIAELVAPAYTVEWHDYNFWYQVWQCNETWQAAQVLARSGIRHLVVEWKATTRPAAFTRLVSACGHVDYTAGGYSAVSIDPDCESTVESTNALPPGIYDERDPHIVFSEHWTHDSRFPATYAGTVSYSRIAGSEVRFAVLGTGFRYVYTKAFNRGEADILVDGAPSATVDLYSPVTEWQARTTIAGLPRARHNVVIRVARGKNGKATDYYIDVDAIEVF